jgi:hypothetical protein
MFVLGRVLQFFHRVVDANNVGVGICNVAVGLWLFRGLVDLVQRNVTTSVYERTYDVG